MSKKAPSATADKTWAKLVTLVMDTRGDWRRRVVEATGLPFGKTRALRRLADRPMALHELAEAMTVDAPAATSRSTTSKRVASSSATAPDEALREARVVDAGGPLARRPRARNRRARAVA